MNEWLQPKLFGWHRPPGLRPHVSGSRYPCHLEKTPAIFMYDCVCCVCVCVCVRARIHKHMHACMHASMTHTHTHTHTCSHAHTCTHTCMLARTHTCNPCDTPMVSCLGLLFFFACVTAACPSPSNAQFAPDARFCLPCRAPCSVSCGSLTLSMPTVHLCPASTISSCSPQRYLSVCVYVCMHLCVCTCMHQLIMPSAQRGYRDGPGLSEGTSKQSFSPSRGVQECNDSNA